uniref:Uncharacterized protein n=1 Tax=Taian Tombu tick virus 1 TaxID=2972342 RepID=A0A9E7V1Z0_9TOMB|nr:MAG: hypothetical protein [Taian Tombu tick virus 1]
MMDSPVVVAAVNTHHIFFTISNLTLNFYNATVIIRHAYKEPDQAEHPAFQTHQPEECSTTKTCLRPSVPRSKSHGTLRRGETPDPDLGDSQTGKQERMGPRVHYTPRQHPLARGDSPVVPTMGFEGSSSVVRAPGDSNDTRDSLNGNPFGLQGRYPELTPVTIIGEGDSKGRPLGPVRTLLPKISDLRIRK